MYLTRSGRSTIDIVSKNIDVPKAFLEQIARELRIAGVLRSIRGPNGGYELVGEPTVGSIFEALNEMTLLSPQEISAYRRGELEHRALASMVSDMAFSLHPVLRRSVKDVAREQVVAEKCLLDKAQPSVRPN
jgi:DNA-binding IscR family transcriptional regulator